MTRRPYPNPSTTKLTPKFWFKIVLKKLENITETEIEIDNLLLGLLICTLKSDFEGDTLDILGFEVEQKSGSDDPDFFSGWPPDFSSDLWYET